MIILLLHTNDHLYIIICIMHLGPEYSWYLHCMNALTNEFLCVFLAVEYWNRQLNDNNHINILTYILYR